MKKKIFGMLLHVEGYFLLLTMCVSLIFGEDDWWVYMLTAVISIFTGVCLLGYNRMLNGKNDAENKNLTRADSFLVVSLAWVLFSMIGMIPFIINLKLDVASAFFETISGFTTTGATVLSNFDNYSHALLFWRSLTQWIGGLGIVVFTFALIPAYELKNNNVFSAEVTGISLDKLKPKIGSTARRLLVIYITLTSLCALCYWAGPMSLYDSICHALTTISTGGFSTHSASIAYFHSAYIEYVCSLFMILSSINFSMFYYAFIRKWDILKKNEELRTFLLAVVVLTAFFTVLFQLAPISNEVISALPSGIEESFRSALFHISTIISSTGFAAQKFDYVAWGAPYWMPTLLIMAIGSCAGSTAGGMKIIRALICMKGIRNEFIKQLHPRAVLSVKLNKIIISDDKVHLTLFMILIYIIMVIFGTIFLTYMGIDADTGIGSCVTALSNVGPGAGTTGPASNFAHIPTLGKWLLSFYMLVGRLEIYTVLLLFVPAFWKENGRKL